MDTNVNPKDKDSLKLLRGIENFAPSTYMTPGSGSMLQQHGPSSFARSESARLRELKGVSDAPDLNKSLDEYDRRHK